MTFISLPAPQTWLTRIAAAVKSVGTIIDRLILVAHQAREASQLCELTDDQLTQRGIERADIGRLVFRGWD